MDRPACPVGSRTILGFPAGSAAPTLRGEPWSRPGDSALRSFRLRRPPYAWMVLTVSQTCRRSGTQLSRLVGCDRRTVAQAGRSRSRTSHRRRDLLRRGDDRSDVTRDEDVYIVGGANSAGQAAMYFSKYARRVVMLVRGSSLAASMSQYLINQLKETPNIQIEFNSSVVEAHGEDRLEAISVHCTVSERGQQSTGQLAVHHDRGGSKHRVAGGYRRTR